MGFSTTRLPSNFSYLAFSAVHFVLFVLAVTTCGLYGVDLHNASSQGKPASSKWIYAEVVGGLSAVTTLLYAVPAIVRFAFVWVWDLVLFVLWIALFGVFGKMYIGEDAEGNAGIQRMKSAVWIDLVCALLWLLTAAVAFGYWWRHRLQRTQFTGRATV